MQIIPIFALPNSVWRNKHSLNKMVSFWRPYPMQCSKWSWKTGTKYWQPSPGKWGWIISGFCRVIRWGWRWVHMTWPGEGLYSDINNKSWKFVHPSKSAVPIVRSWGGRASCMWSTRRIPASSSVRVKSRWIADQQLVDCGPSRRKQCKKVKLEYGSYCRCWLTKK